MSPLEGLPGAVHRGDVERLVDVVAVAELERVGDGAVVDHVAVKFGPGVERRVERLGLLGRVLDPDIGREHRVERLDEHLGPVGGGRVEVDDLTQRMDPGVGSARSRW